MTQEERINHLESQLQKALGQLREVKGVLRKLGHAIGDETDGMSWQEVLLEAVKGNPKYLYAWYRDGKPISARRTSPGRSKPPVSMSAM